MDDDIRRDVALARNERTRRPERKRRPRRAAVSRLRAGG
jgi:hypothetical protein